MLERAYEKHRFVAWIVLDFEKRGWELILSFAFARDNVPHTDRVIGRCAYNLVARTAPTQRAHRVHVSGYNLSNSSCEKIPDKYAAVIATDRQQCSTASKQNFAVFKALIKF